MGNSTKESGRLETLDLLRGITLVSMILYHGLWDFLYLSESGAAMTGLRLWYEGPGGHLWQQSICRTFILLSGFCVPFSRHIFRRGLQVSAGGAAVTAVTLAVMYEERVLFGVLTFLGASMLLTGFLQKAWIRFFLPRSLCLPHKKTAAPGSAECGGEAEHLKGQLQREPLLPAKAGLYLLAAAASGYLFFVFRWVNAGYLRFWPGLQAALPHVLYRDSSGGAAGYLLTGLGFPMQGFFSTDYFSLLPWIFLFLAGLFLHRCLASAASGKVLRHPLFHLQVPVLNSMGRHSLLLYLLHQPVLYLVTLLLFS